MQEEDPLDVLHSEEGIHLSDFQIETYSTLRLNYICVSFRIL